MRNPLDPLDRISPHIQRSQLHLSTCQSTATGTSQSHVLLQSLDLLQPIVTDVQLLQAIQLLQPFQLGNPVRLYRQHSKRLERLEALATAQTNPVSNTRLTCNLVILFFPSQSSSSFPSPSSPSIDCRLVRPCPHRAYTPTLIRFPPSSKLLKHPPKPCTPDIFVILFCTKNIVCSSWCLSSPLGTLLSRLNDKSSILHHC